MLNAGTFSDRCEWHLGFKRGFSKLGKNHCDYCGGSGVQRCWSKEGRILLSYLIALSVLKLDRYFVEYSAVSYVPQKIVPPNKKFGRDFLNLYKERTLVPLDDIPQSLYCLGNLVQWRRELNLGGVVYLFPLIWMKSKRKSNWIWWIQGIHPFLIYELPRLTVQLLMAWAQVAYGEMLSGVAPEDYNQAYLLISLIFKYWGTKRTSRGYYHSRIVMMEIARYYIGKKLEYWAKYQPIFETLYWFESMVVI